MSSLSTQKLNNPPFFLVSHTQFSRGLQSSPSHREKGEMAEFGSSKAAAKLSHFSLKSWRRSRQQERLLILPKRGMTHNFFLGRGGFTSHRIRFWFNDYFQADSGALQVEIPAMSIAGDLQHIDLLGL